MEKKTFIELISNNNPEELNEFLKEKGKYKLRAMIGMLKETETKK